jgi:hypothetical protein
MKNRKNAGKIVGAIAKQCGGGGGGKLPEKLAEVLDSATNLV